MTSRGVLGVLLAGGRGMRLRLGRPKAFAEVGGKTLLARTEALLSTVCDEIVIAAPPDLDLPEHHSPRVADAAGKGPIAGLVAGLSARPFDRAIVLGVDFPLMRAAMLQSLLARLGEGAAVIPAPAGIPQPLAAAYAPSAVASLAASLASRKRVTDAALALDPLILDDAQLQQIEGGSKCFFNLNTPEDLEEANRRLAGHGGRESVRRFATLSRRAEAGAVARSRVARRSQDGGAERVSRNASRSRVRPPAKAPGAQSRKPR